MNDRSALRSKLDRTVWHDIIFSMHSVSASPISYSMVCGDVVQVISVIYDVKRMIVLYPHRATKYGTAPREKKSVDVNRIHSHNFIFPHGNGKGFDKPSSTYTIDTQPTHTRHGAMRDQTVASRPLPCVPVRKPLSAWPATQIDLDPDLHRQVGDVVATSVPSRQLRLNAAPHTIL